jgi:hypothetical protein
MTTWDVLYWVFMVLGSWLLMELFLVVVFSAMVVDEGESRSLRGWGGVVLCSVLFKV